MRRLVQGLVILVGVIAALWGIRHHLEQSLQTTAQGVERQPLYIFNWGDYIYPELITAFEEESNYRVIYLIPMTPWKPSLSKAEHPMI